MGITFFKYQGTGNDFVIIDGRENRPVLSGEQIARICHRRFGIGADGLMVLLGHPELDFEMKYYNADGRQGSLCGNGGRCIVRFAHAMGIHRDTYRFLAADGVHDAEIERGGRVRLKMNDVTNVRASGADYVLDTGSPHFVKFVTELSDYRVTEEGRSIRNSTHFVKDGINVNFVETVDDHTIFVRTFERGVEAETWSCGTGVTASALVSAHNEAGFNEVDVQTLGGKLSVEYDRISETEYRNIWLCGPAEFVFEGQIEIS
jgi:diaminopimelate epimerase